MAEETAPSAEEKEQKRAELEARLKGEEKPEGSGIKFSGNKVSDPDTTIKEPEKPKADPEPDPEVEKVIAQADKPDAVRNAIQRHQQAAREAREEAEELKAQVKQYEDRDKSEQEKLEERAATAERDAAEAKSKLLRIEVAGAKNLPMELADRLRGKTQKELEADAERLLELVKPSTPSGDVGAGKGVGGTNDEDFSEVLRRQSGVPTG